MKTAFFMIEIIIITVSTNKQKFNPIFWAQDIDRIVLKSRYPNQTVKCQHVSINISTSENRIEFSVASLKPWRQPCNLTSDEFLFFTKGGAEIFFGEPPPKLKSIFFIFFFNFPLFIIYKGMEKTLRIIPIMKNAVFTTPYPTPRTMTLLGGQGG